MSRAWYSYQGTGNTSLPENYVYSSATPTCVSGRTVCAIYAIYAGINPNSVTTRLQNYIATGKATGLAQPSTPIGAKKFVYLFNV